MKGQCKDCKHRDPKPQPLLRHGLAACMAITDPMLRHARTFTESSQCRTGQFKPKGKQ